MKDDFIQEFLANTQRYFGQSQLSQRRAPSLASRLKALPRVRDFTFSAVKPSKPANTSRSTRQLLAPL